MQHITFSKEEIQKCIDDLRDQNMSDIIVYKRLYLKEIDKEKQAMWLDQAKKATDDQAKVLARIKELEEMLK